MRIVLDARLLRRTTGGIGRYTQSLIRELSLLSDDEFVVLMTPADVEDWQILSKEAGLRPPKWQAEVVDIPHYSWAEQTQLPAILTKLKPDLVHFTNFNHPLRYQAPFVATVHDLTIFLYPFGAKQRSPITQFAFRKVLRHAATAGKKVIADSEATKRDIVKFLHVGPDKVQTVHLGVDPDYQPINLPQRGRIHTYLNEVYNIKPPYLLFLSQWRPHKGIDVLLDAYEKLRTADPKLAPKLVVAGKPHSSYPEIGEKLKNHPFAADITAPGFVKEEDLPKLYQGAEIFVCPSLYEGFGIPPLEAMACGTPVISSNSSSLPEVIGDAGVLVPVGDASALATAMQNLLKDHTRMRDLHDAGLRRARQFTWPKVAQETLDIYHKAA